MKLLGSILVLYLIISYTENPIVENNEQQYNKLEIEFYNNSLIYDLENYEIPVGFKLINISNEDIQIDAHLYYDRVSLSQIVQHKVDGTWITDYALTSDTIIVLKAKEYLSSEFFVFLKGEWRTLINLGNGDTLCSNSVIVLNEVEKLIEFNIQCLESNLIEVNIKNNSESDIKLVNQKFGYCHFSFMLYDFVDNSIYKPLYWNHIDSRWGFPAMGPDIQCLSEPSKIFVLAGEEYTTLIDDVMPRGTINARLRFYFTNNNKNYETISKIFEYY